MADGLVVKALSGFYYVKINNQILECKPRGKFKYNSLSPVVGDRVRINGNVIESIYQRKNYFIRPNVSNVDYLVFVATNTKPITDPFLIDRVSVIAEANNCELIVCINKTDLDNANELFAIYNDSGFITVRTSAETGEGIDELLSVISGHVSAFTGNSGVGKSSILNRILPDARIATDSISDKLGRGKHTTRHIEFYMPCENTFIADTPGYASFEIEMMNDISIDDLPKYFIEFSDYIGSCKFNDCRHINEPNCAIKSALSHGKIKQSRYDSYLKLFDIISNKRKSWD